MTHKYFTWTEGQYHKGQDLLSKQQIATLITHTNKPSECYATIQDYDSKGVAIGCPIYFDIDSPDLYEAYNEMRNLCEDLETEFDTTPAVWFSGSKGFHVVLPIYIRHERCHEIVGMIANEFKAHAFDSAVYRQRSMWRCQGTWNNKGKRYKVRTDVDEQLSPLLKRSEVNGELNMTLEPFILKDMSQERLSSYISMLPDRSHKIVEIMNGGDMMPCLKKLWDMDAPAPGQAHQLCHVVSRWCFKSGLDRQEAVSLFAEHVFWKQQNPRDYEKVIDSVYRTGRAHIGCRTGRDAEILQPHCQWLCHFNEDFKLREVFSA